MTKTRLMAFLVLSVTLICGCMGGGGGGGTPVFEKDVAGITATLNRFAESLRAGDPTSSGVFAQTTGTSETTKILYVKDFGADLNNPNDNQTWEFRVNPADITQPAPDTAIVKASKVMSTGNTLWLIFSMLKEEGQWKIQGITIQETGVTTLVSASYFPIVPGNRMTYYNTYQSGGSYNIYSREYSTTDVYEADGVKYYRVIMPDSGANLRPAAQLANSSGYHGIAANGEIWAYDPYINGGVPYRMLKTAYAPGEKDVIIEKYGETEVYTTTITIGSQMKPLVTPLRTFMTLPVTQETSYNYNGTIGTHTEILYFAEGVGLVGTERFGQNTTVESTELLYERLVNGVPDRNIPVVSAPANSQNVVIGQSMVPVQFSVAGGSAPYVWSVNGATWATITQTGYVSGKPDATVPQTYNMTVGVVDAYNRSSSFNYVLNVVNVPVLSITPTNGTQNVVLGQPIANVGFSVANATGQVTWSISGQPSGLSISDTGVMSGSVSSSAEVKTYPITVSATDAIGATGSADYTLVVSPPGVYQMSLYRPVVSGDEYTYAVLDQYEEPTTYRAIDGHSNDSITAGGMTLYRSYSFYAAAQPVPSVSLRASVKASRRPAVRGQTAPEEEFYRAMAADGSVWAYQMYTNGGQPFMVRKAWYNPGEAFVVKEFYDKSGVASYTVTTTMTVGNSPESIVITPYGTFNDVLKITYEMIITQKDSQGNDVVVEQTKHDEYCAKGVGLVAYHAYDTDNVTIIQKELLLSAKLGGTIHENLPQITNAQNLGTVTVGSAITPIILNATGGFEPYSFSLIPGATLPQGLTLSSSGIIEGTPTSSGIYNIAVILTDKYYQAVEKVFSITIN